MGRGQEAEIATPNIAGGDGALRASGACGDPGWPLGLKLGAQRFGRC